MVADFILKGIACLGGSCLFVLSCRRPDKQTTACEAYEIKTDPLKQYYVQQIFRNTADSRGILSFPS